MHCIGAITNLFDIPILGTKNVGYNRMRFLLDSLQDIDRQLQEATEGRGGLLICEGQPVHIFRRLHEHVGLHKICVEQDCEPIWNERDEAVKSLCRELSIEYVEKVSHTLWDPRTVIDTNGGIAPLTYQMFLVSNCSSTSNWCLANHCSTCSTRCR